MRERRYAGFKHGNKSYILGSGRLIARCRGWCERSITHTHLKLSGSLSVNDKRKAVKLKCVHLRLSSERIMVVLVLMPSKA